MPSQVVAGATATCTFGTAPAALVPPVHQCLAGAPSANVTDQAPVVTVCPFGACTSLANPSVASATAAKGVLDPKPCSPVPAGPWLPGAVKAILKGAPTLDSGSVLACAWGGVIRIVNPGQFRVTLG